MVFGEFDVEGVEGEGGGDGRVKEEMEVVRGGAGEGRG